MLQKVMDALSAIQAGIAGMQQEQTNLATRVGQIEQRISDKAYSLPGVEDEKQKFSFARAIAAITLGRWDLAPFEKEVFDQTRKRAMDTTTGSMGYTVPQQIMSEIIEMFRAEAVLIKMGARTLTNLTGSPVSWPKQLTGATAYWVGENQPITESAATAGQLLLAPKKVAALCKMSNDLSPLSNPDAEALVRSDMAIALALAIDLAGLRGSGSEYQPRGIANISGIGSVAIGTNGGTFTWEHASQLEGKLEDANALRGSLGFVWNPKVKRLLKRLRVAQFSGDTGGAYIIKPMSDRELEDYLGYRFGQTTQVPANLTKGSGTALSEVYFGNWAEMLIGMWGGLELLASNVAGDNTGGAFSSDQLWIRAIQRVDIGLRHAASFALCSDAATTGA
jgi:HK97 family phage major capsid protein